MTDFGSAIIGAGAALTTAVISGYGLENYRRHKDRQGIASALYGEISALINITEENKIIEILSNLVVAIEKNKNFKMKSMSTPISNANPVFDKVADKIGLFPDNIPEYIARFYNGLMGYRKTFSELYMGSYDNDHDRKLMAIQAVVKIAKEGERISEILLPKLLIVANKSWVTLSWHRWIWVKAKIHTGFSYVRRKWAITGITIRK